MKLTQKTINRSTAQKIGDDLKVNWDKYDVDQFVQGLKVELEHGSKDKKTDVTHNDARATGKIVLAHLKEAKDYYTKLKKVERGQKSPSKRNKHG